MKLEKAIEILNDYFERETIVSEDDFWVAFKLGIEALKREKERRSYAQVFNYRLLPGETEE